MKAFFRVGPSLAVILAVSCLLSCSRDPNQRKQKLLQSGQRYFEKARYSESVIEYRNALKIDQNFLDARYALAKSYLKLQKWGLAYQELKRTIELQPDNYSAHRDLANLLIATGSLQAAQEEADLLIQQRPNESQTHFMVANLLAAQSRYPDAIVEMQKAIAIEPGNWNFYLNLALMQMKNNEPDLAEANFKVSAELNRNSADARFMLAEFYQSRHRYSDAEEFLRAAISLDTHNPDLRSALARLYLIEGKKAEAAEFLSRVKQDFPDNSAGYRMLGDFYFNIGDLNKALDEYASLYKEHPKDFEVTKNYIQLLILTNHTNEASKLNRDVLESHPNDGQCMTYAAQLHIRVGEYGEAKQILEKVTQNDSTNADAHYQLSIASRELGDEESAERELRAAVKLRPDLVDAQRSLALTAMKKGDMVTLEQASAQLINFKPASSEGYALRAVSEMNRKQYASAEKDIRDAIEVARQSHLGYVQMGNLRSLQKRYNEAADAYQDGLTRDPTSIDALRGLMNTFIAQAQVDKAVAVAEVQISKRPNISEFYDLLGTVLLRNKHDLDAAEIALKKSADLNSRNLDAVIKLGEVELTKGNNEEALAIYRQGLKDHPREASFAILMGDLYKSQQNWADAAVLYQQALTLRPEDPIVSGNLAFVMLESGQNLDSALSFAQTARRALPDSPSAADTLGWAYYEKGAYRAAIPLFQEALRLRRETKSPDDSRVHYHLGMAYLKTGQPGLSRQHLQLALKINPSSADATEARKQLAEMRL